MPVSARCLRLFPVLIGEVVLWALLPSLVLFLNAPDATYAQVVTNITSTTGTGNLGTTVTQAGNVYNITGGTRPGNGPNLFHSFGDFSVGGGDIGNFLNNTGLPTSNILGRVTGGNISNIDGMIQTTGFGNANVFLVNPSGIVFGPNGSVNVGGSVSFTTAQYLRLFDGVNSANFYANPANDGLANSVLAVAPVVDFGFLSPAAYGFLTPPDPSATITVQGSALSVPSGQSISLVGGKVVIQGATLPDGTVQPAHLSAPNGTIQLASTASPGEFDVATLQPLPNVDGASFTSLGSVSLAPGSSIDVSGQRTVFVKGGQLVLSVNDATLSTTENSVPSDTVSLSAGSSIVTSNSATEPGADAQITVGALQMEGASIQSTTTGDGSGGNITADVGTLALTNGAMITSSSNSTDSTAGHAGTITIQGIAGSGSPAADVSLDNSRIGTAINGGSAANTAATITITAQTLALANGANIGADTGYAALAGNITLNVGTLTTEGFFYSTIYNGGNNITIQGVTGSGSPATNVSLDHIMIITGSNGGTSTSTPVTITITAHTLALANAVILNGAYGPALAGNIILNVGTLTVASDSQIDSSSIFIDSSTAGHAGSITIQGVTGSGSPAAHVSLDHGVLSTFMVGGTAATTPGAITITAHTLALANGHIGADTVGTGPAGDIVLNVGTLTAGHSTISSGSPLIDSTTGNAGSITIQGITGSGSPAAHVSLDNSTISTGINGGTSTSTPATITITAHTLALANEALINAGAVGAAPAGNITLNVGTLTVENSTISSSSAPAFIDEFEAFSEGGGDAGDISIQGVIGSGSPAANVSLDNSVVSTTIVGGTSSNMPANITIAAHAVSLSNDVSITASTTGNAPAGNIELVTQQLTMTPDSAITSNAQTGGTGTAGSITITGAGSAPTTIAGGTIQAQSETSASAGDITLQAPGDLTLLGTTVSVKNTGPGSAGSINLRAGNDLLIRNTKVSTESAEASGGNIKLIAPNLVRIVDSTLTSSVKGQARSNGGNINIDPQWVVIQNSQLLANANAGAGGNITIAATGAVLIVPNSLLSASAGPAGVSGSVNIIAPIQVLSGTLVPLKLAYSQAELSSDRCTADPTGQFSSFVQTGREGVPQIPGALSPSPLSFLETLTSGSLGSPSPNWAAARLGLDSVRYDDATRFQFHSACRS